VQRPKPTRDCPQHLCLDNGFDNLRGWMLSGVPPAHNRKTRSFSAATRTPKSMARQFPAPGVVRPTQDPERQSAGAILNDFRLRVHLRQNRRRGKGNGELHRLNVCAR
jgi:hypothetical protein